MNGNKIGRTKRSLIGRRENFNKLFNPQPEKEIDIELEDLYVDENEKNNFLDYKADKISKVNEDIDHEDIDKRLQKYKPKQVSYEDWKKREYDNKENGHKEELNGEDSINENDDTLNEISGEKEKNLVKETINTMEKEDEMYLEQILKIKPDEIKKSKSVADQKKVYDSLLGIRIYIQNILQDINKLPQSEQLIEEIKNDENLSHLYQITDNNFMDLFINLLGSNKDLNLKGSFKNILNNNTNNIDITENINNILNNVSEQKEITNDKIFSELDDNFGNILAVSEKVLNIWYRKTLVYNNKQNSKLLKVLNVNNFSEHIKKSIDDNFDTIRLKTKRKREKFRILGKPISSFIEDEDDNIYDDTDFYEFLLKEFLSSQEVDESQNLNNRYDLTMQYLLNRRNKLKNNKNYDKKASKNRKLRFEQHEKILNFMTPEANLNETGRDEIINSLFGGKRIKNKDDNSEIIDVSII